MILAWASPFKIKSKLMEPLSVSWVKAMTSNKCYYLSGHKKEADHDDRQEKIDQGDLHVTRDDRAYVLTESKVGLMVAHRLRRSSNINTTLG